MVEENSNGNQFENKVREIFENKGFHCVTRTGCIGSDIKYAHSFNLVVYERAEAFKRNKLPKHIVECKGSRFRANGEVPHGKLDGFHSDGLFMRDAKSEFDTLKDITLVFALSKHYSEVTHSTLTEYCMKHYGYLLNNIELWEVSGKSDNPIKYNAKASCLM